MLLTQHNFCSLVTLAALANFHSMLSRAALPNFCSMLPRAALPNPHRHHRTLIAERLRREARNPATMPLRRSAEMGSVRFRVTTGCEVERPPVPARVVADAATRCFCFGG